MASSFQFGYADPSNFSDWASYAGFDRKTGQMTPIASDAGIAPPETFGEMFDQKVANPFNKVAQGVQAVGTNLSNAATQIGQGNGMAAVNAARGVKPVQQPMQPTQPTIGWNLSSHIED